MEKKKVIIPVGLVVGILLAAGIFRGLWKDGQDTEEAVQAESPVIGQEEEKDGKDPQGQMTEAETKPEQETIKNTGAVLWL